MCGFAGILALNSKIDPEAVSAERMADRLFHRGPDDRGIFVDPDRRLALAFRRLAIIDLKTGGQPITDEDQTIHLVCNGEIYNFQSLRDELVSRGHRFRSTGDIEPIVHLYEEQGVRFLDRLDGFFALALYDARRQRLILAVDRVGKKPLYYTQHDGRLYFASELKAFESLAFPRQIDHASVIDYLRFGYIPAPETLYRDIHKLPPGHRIEIDLPYHRQIRSDRLPPPIPYHQPRSPAFEGSYTDAKSHLSDLMTQAVAKRLTADVPLGVLLSGGIDSAIVTALASRVSNDPVKTFSVGFKSELYNELPLARKVAGRYRTDHTELVVEPDLHAMLETVVSIYDEPFADSSAIPTYLVCRKAGDHVRVVLTGDGGDEGFGGYDRYRAIAVSALLHKAGLRPHFGDKTFTPGKELRSKRMQLWRLMQAISLSPASQYSMYMRVFYESQLEQLLGPALKSSLGRPDWVAQAFDGVTHKKSPCDKAMLCDRATYLPGDLLVKMDRASMASSLEVRSPFLDHAVLEFAQSLPVRYKVGFNRGKRIVRETFRHLLPGEILSAPKRGFGVPMGQWLKGPIRQQMESVLSPSCRMAKQGLIEPRYVKTLADEHLAGRFDHGARLWSLMVLETTLRSLG